MARFGFCGATYQAQSLNANAQRCVNLYLEHDESGSGKSEWQMYNTPGLALFAFTVGRNRSNGIYQGNGRCFFVADAELYELLADGTVNDIAAVGNDGTPVQMANSETQLLILSAGKMYGFTLSTSTFLGQVGALLGSISQIAYSDGFFFALVANSQTVFQSNPLDVQTWPGNQFTIVSVFPDNIISMNVSQRELWFRGATKSVSYANTGAVPFAFTPNLSGYMEEGTAAQWAEVRLDNTLFWLSQNERGSLVAYRLNGYNPLRVSKYAIENQWQGYSVTSDALGWSYEDRGHKFWVIYFPTQNATWVYDVASGEWHERTWLNPATGQPEGHLAISHTFAFGRHLVGDRRNGNIYQMNIGFVDDDGYPIQRLRRAPHISTEQYRIRHHQLQIDVEAGENPSPAPLVGVTATRIHVGAGTNVPIGNLGSLDVVVMALMLDGSRKIASFTNLINDTSDQQMFTLPPLPNVSSWRFYFAATGTATTYVVTLPVNSATAGYTYSTLLGGFYYLGPATLSATGVLLSFLIGPLNPALIVRWSDDGGHTYGNEHIVNVGGVGQYSWRAILWQLGMARDRVYEVSCSDPIAWRFIDAYLQADGFQPTERLTAQLRKQA